MKNPNARVNSGGMRCENSLKRTNTRRTSAASQTRHHMTTSAEHVHPDWRTTREEEAPSALGAFFRSISLGFGALNLFGEETPVVEVDKPARGLAEEDGLKGYRPESPEDDLERYQMWEYIAPAPSTTGVRTSSRPWEQLTVTDMASPAEASAILTWGDCPRTIDCAR